MFKVIDLFSGVGGMSLGFKKEGFDVTMAIEKDKEISEAYKKNHPNVEVISKDIREIDKNKFNYYKKQNTIVVGGPPCQGFSQKGSRNILKDSRNYLFKHFYNMVEIIKPKYFLMENVPNILTANNGYFKKQILDLFNKLNYSVDYKILSSYNFGVPQKRNRAFILGKKGNEKLSLPKNNSNAIVNIGDAISDLEFLNSGEGKFKQDYKFSSKSKYQKKAREKSGCLYNHVATNHSDTVIKRLKMIPVGGDRSDLPKEHLTKSVYSGTWSRMLYNEPSVTITTRFDTPSSGKFTHPVLNRAITIREAARLQSFPDDFIFYGTKSSKMKQVGNAVPPLLAQEIAKTIKFDINKSREVNK